MRRALVKVLAPPARTGSPAELRQRAGTSAQPRCRPPAVLRDPPSQSKQRRDGWWTRISRTCSRPRRTRRMRRRAGPARAASGRARAVRCRSRRAGPRDRPEASARHALTLLDGREDRLGEIGSAQLVLGRSLLEQGRLDDASAAFDEAENTFEKFESTSHRAAVWIAKGDLVARRGDDTGAARLYRRAAEALQDFRF